jgi:hypothetical protein
MVPFARTVAVPSMAPAGVSKFIVTVPAGKPAPNNIKVSSVCVELIG